MFFNQIIFYSHYFLILCNICFIPLLKLVCTCANIWTFSSWYYQIQHFLWQKGQYLCSGGLFLCVFGNYWLEVGILHKAGSSQSKSAGEADSSDRLVSSRGDWEQLFEQWLQPKVLNTFSWADLVTAEKAELMVMLLRVKRRGGR